MKRCPSCNRTYTDQSLNFCLEDGTPLLADVGGADPNATVRYPSARDTGEPPPTEIYREPMPMLNQVAELSRPQQQPHWSPTPVVTKKKSGAVWWILGGVAVLGIIGIGMIVMIIAIASLSSNTNGNSNSNSRIVNRNSSANSNRSKTNSGSSALYDDFSDQKWGSSNSQYGDTWYEDGEYHMRSKPKTFVVMYAPSQSYSSENAIVKVTARSVAGNAESTGFGLIIHGERKGSSQMEDYALLIYTGEEPKYQVVLHKDGNQTPIIGWTTSSIIRTGTSPNQLEARVNGNEISFYINGQYVNRITDKENLKDGRVGFYTSDVAEVAFDDLEITPK